MQLSFNCSRLERHAAVFPTTPGQKDVRLSSQLHQARKTCGYLPNYTRPERRAAIFPTTPGQKDMRLSFNCSRPERHAAVFPTTPGRKQEPQIQLRISALRGDRHFLNTDFLRPWCRADTDGNDTAPVGWLSSKRCENLTCTKETEEAHTQVRCSL